MLPKLFEGPFNFVRVEPERARIRCDRHKLIRMQSVGVEKKATLGLVDEFFKNAYGICAWGMVVHFTQVPRSE
jgi:hypothetical protein